MWLLDGQIPLLDSGSLTSLDGGNNPVPASDPSHRHFSQVATIWRTTPDGFGGYSFAYPELINCRWEDKAELIPGSATEASSAVVYPESEVSAEDYLYLGSSGELSPTSVVGARRVRAFSRIPNLRNLKTIYKCWLQ